MTMTLYRAAIRNGNKILWESTLLDTRNAARCTLARRYYDAADMWVIYRCYIDCRKHKETKTISLINKKGVGKWISWDAKEVYQY